VDWLVVRLSLRVTRHALQPIKNQQGKSKIAAKQRDFFVFLLYQIFIP